jgi:hypothetical protein
MRNFSRENFYLFLNLGTGKSKKMINTEKNFDKNERAIKKLSKIPKNF